MRVRVCVKQEKGDDKNKNDYGNEREKESGFTSL